MCVNQIVRNGNEAQKEKHPPKVKKGETEREREREREREKEILVVSSSLENTSEPLQ